MATDQATPVSRPSAASSAYPPSGTNRFARWARWCGLLGVVPVALVLGVVGLFQVRRTGQRGKGAAVLGIVAALFWAGIWANLASSFGPDVRRSPNGSVAAALVDSVIDLRVGDCFRNSTRAPDPNDGVDSVTLVPCDQAHDGKVYATPVLPVRNDLTAEMAARAACQAALPAGTPSGEEPGFFYPTPLLYAHGNSRASCFTNP
ncbi:DUF4190 domain-containing protein [Streptomyces tateyamensis]|uniref:DUF4190 domain-containing protein n=1 Tax=Streptomyces tateyamensis TaxID=565073 RepID=UPI0011B49A4C|nr:DUF4190 domain-containing protein [Streptomyces tateyamensis]